MDGALVFAFGKTYALEVFPFGFVSWEEAYCGTTSELHCLPFQSNDEHTYGQVLSLG